MKLVEALASYEAAISMNSLQSSSWFGKGTVLALLARYDEAESALNQALELDPGNEMAWILRARCRLANDRLGPAIEAVERALSLSPQNPEALTVSGAILCRLARHEEAIECLNTALQLNPMSVEAWNCKGDAQATMGWHAGALESYERALNLNPRDPLAAMGKATALLSLERFSEAEMALARAVQLNPDWLEGRKAQFQLRQRLHPTTTLPQNPVAYHGFPPYRCKDCGHEWEDDGSSASRYLSDYYGGKCPTCGGELDGDHNCPNECGFSYDEWVVDWLPPCPECGSWSVDRL